MVVTGARDSPTVTTSNETPVKRPLFSSTSRWPISKSASVS